MEILLKKIKADEFYKDLVITFIGQVLVMVLSFVLNKIISNQYSIEEFGIYNLIRRFISVVSFVMLMAMGIAIPKYIAESKSKKNNIMIESYMVSGLVIIISMFFILSAVLITGKNWFSLTIFNDIGAQIFIIPICLYSFGNGLVTYAYSYYRGINNFKRYNIISIAMQFGLIIMTFMVNHNLYFLYLGWSLFLVVYGTYEIIIIYHKSNLHIRNISQNIKTLKTMLIYSIPRVPGEFILFAYNLIPLTIISYKFGKEQVGFFSAALSINSLITPLFSLVGTILLPLVSGSKFNNTTNEVNKKIKVLGYIYTGVSVLSIVFVYFFGEILLTVLFNKNYTECIDIVKIVIISIVPNAFYLLLRNPLDGKSDFPYNTICLLVSFIVYVVMLYFATSIEMCAIALTIAYTFLGGMSLIIWKILCRK